MRQARHSNNDAHGGHDHGAEYDGHALRQQDQFAAQRDFCRQGIEVDSKRIGQGFNFPESVTLTARTGAKSLIYL